MALAYRTADLGRSSSSDQALVRALQQDLRLLGYLPGGAGMGGIDGDFGKYTRQAVRSLQYDLLHNSGHGSDADAQGNRIWN